MKFTIIPLITSFRIYRMRCIIFSLPLQRPIIMKRNQLVSCSWMNFFQPSSISRISTNWVTKRVYFLTTLKTFHQVTPLSQTPWFCIKFIILQCKQNKRVCICLKKKIKLCRLKIVECCVYISEYKEVKYTTINLNFNLDYQNIGR